MLLLLTLFRFPYIFNYKQCAFSIYENSIGIHIRKSTVYHIKANALHISAHTHFSRHACTLPARKFTKVVKHNLCICKMSINSCIYKHTYTHTQTYVYKNRQIIYARAKKIVFLMFLRPKKRTKKKRTEYMHAYTSFYNVCIWKMPKAHVALSHAWLLACTQYIHTHNVAFAQCKFVGRARRIMIRP